MFRAQRLVWFCLGLLLIGCAIYIKSESGVIAGIMVMASAFMFIIGGLIDG